MNEERNTAETTDAPIFHRIGRRKKRRNSLLGICYDWLGSFVAALLCVVVLFTFVFRVVRVSGDSMLPTLQDGNILIISDVAYQPQKGDIVVLQVPSYKNGLPLIKRVIATEGQKVEIDFENWTVKVDGAVLDETYVNFMEGAPMERFTCPSQFTVKEGCVFVMGDNRNDSNDSRNSAIGQVDARYILGKVVIRLSSSPFGTPANPLTSPFEN